jgi:chromatin segregation and condensation protein Rec8/ScpA/Scc1 (kleisin family)
MFDQEYAPPTDPLFVPDDYCELTSLQEAMVGVLNNLPKKVVRPTAQVKPTVSLEEMMAKLKNRVESEMKIKFSTIRRNEKEHKDVIVGFLAVLELFKQGDILIYQSDQFGDIHLELERATIPRYY